MKGKFVVCFFFVCSAIVYIFKLLKFKAEGIRDSKGRFSSMKLVKKETFSSKFLYCLQST